MSDPTDDLPVEPGEGITESEQAEIRTHIEQVVTENRIPVESSDFELADARRGVLFPIIINAAAVVGVLLAILILRAFFRSDELRVQTEAFEYASIEGRLIRELRQESQELLLTKDQEIDSVRAQLERVRSERLALEQDFETQIATREEELRAQLEAEIAAERTRLIAEGLGSDEIDRLMEDFEAERRAFYEQQLEAYRVEIEAERNALIAGIDRQEAEYQARLSALQSERDALIAEYQEREDALQVQLEQQTRVLALAQSAATADLEAAQRELSQLAREEEERASIELQIVGQIEGIRSALQQGDDPLALRRIESLIRYLGEDQVRAVRQLSRRRELDVFLLDQLRTVIQGRQLTASGERSITSELALLSEVRSLSLAAAGATTASASLETYSALLGRIPEISEAHEAVVADARETAVTEAIEEQRGRISGRLEAATTLFEAGDYDRAISEYEEALFAIPALEGAVDRLVSDVLSAGYSLSAVTRGDESSSRLAGLASRTGLDLDADRQAFQNQIEDAIDQREAELGIEIDTAGEEIERLRELVASLEQDRDILEARLGTATSQSAEEQATALAQTEQTRAELAARNEEIQAEVETLNEQIEATTRQLESAETQRARLEQEIARLSPFERRLNEARTVYSSYVDAQARLLSGEGLTAEEQTQLLDIRDRFLRDDAVDWIFADLVGKLADYDQQVQAEAQVDSLSSTDLTDFLAELSAIPSAAGRQTRLAIEREAAADSEDVALQEFLDTLALIVNQN